MVCKRKNESEEEFKKRAKEYRNRPDVKRKTVRGILCRSCNIGLGYIEKRPALKTNAASYLQQHETNACADALLHFAASF